MRPGASGLEASGKASSTVFRGGQCSEVLEKARGCSGPAGRTVPGQHLGPHCRMRHEAEGRWAGPKVVGSCVLEAHLAPCGSSASAQRPDGAQGPGEREFCQARQEHGICWVWRDRPELRLRLRSPSRRQAAENRGVPGTWDPEWREEEPSQGDLCRSRHFFGLGGAEGSGSWTLPSKGTPSPPACPRPQWSVPWPTALWGHHGGGPGAPFFFRVFLPL